jgi:iron complex transport system substrate-binding protein
VFCVLTLLAALAPVARADAPQRILSFNLCADQLVIALADPSQIAGVSPFATDPATSVIAEEAKRYPRAEARSEAAIALKPDLVLVGPIDRAGIRRTLKHFGLRVVEVGLVADIAAARAQVREVAALLGHSGRGEFLIAEIDAARARLAKVARKPPATALLIERAGYVTGPESIAAALLREAGFFPPAGAPAGLGGFVPLERLLTLRPDYLAFYEQVSRPDDQGSIYLTHPALKERYPPSRRLVLPRRYALCGGPALVAALDYLTQTLSASAPTR